VSPQFLENPGFFAFATKMINL
jgi:hypothetical protein